MVSEDSFVLVRFLFWFGLIGAHGMYFIESVVAKGGIVARMARKVHGTLARGQRSDRFAIRVDGSGECILLLFGRFQFIQTYTYHE